MRTDTLPSPGFLSNGIRIRIEAAKAISAIEINAGIPVNAGKSSNAFQFKTFLDACNAAIVSFLDVVAPTLVSQSIIGAQPDTIAIAFSEGLDPKKTPLPGVFTIGGQTRTIASVTISGPFVYIKVTVPFVAGAVTVSYTQAGNAIDLQDFSGNKAATFAAQAVTNGVV